jgi:hypothetical protein
MEIKCANVAAFLLNVILVLHIANVPIAHGGNIVASGFVRQLLKNKLNLIP